MRFVDGGCHAVQGVKSFQFEEVAQGQADEEQGYEACACSQNKTPTTPEVLAIVTNPTLSQFVLCLQS